MMVACPRSRLACVLLACAAWPGCALDPAGKTACRTDRDCNPGRVCSMSRCVARDLVLGAGESGSGTSAGADAGDTEQDGGAGQPGPGGDEPGACSVGAASETCEGGAESCEELDFDRVDGVCTKRDDCAGVSSCDPGECVDGTRTYTCSCPAGFMAQNNACLPAAGCAKLMCSQRCVGELAKPSCACDGELVLASDDRSCKSGAWSEPRVLSETGSLTGAVALAVSRTGPAMVIYQQNVSGVLELWYQPFRENAWGRASRLGLGEAHDGNIDVAIDDLGRSTVIYEESDTTGRHQFWASYANGGWNLRELLDGSVSGLEHPSDIEGFVGVKVASSGLGHVYAIWRHARVTPEGGTEALYVNELSHDNVGSVARMLAPDVSFMWGANDMDVSVDEGGIAVAVWTTVATETQGAVAMIDAFHDRAWAGPRPVDLGGLGAPALRASLAPAGRTTHILWINDDGVYHRELAPDGTPNELVAPLAGKPGFVTSVAAGKSVIVLWTERNDADTTLLASVKAGDGAWSAPSTVASTAGLLFPASFRGVSDGSAAFLWAEQEGTALVAFLSRYSPTEDAWSAPMRITSEGATVGSAELGMDEGHRIMVAWSERPLAGTTSRILVRRFE